MPPPDGTDAPTIEAPVDPVEAFARSEVTAPTPAPDPVPAPADAPDIVEQFARQTVGAKQALLASSLAGASDDYGTKIAAADHAALVQRHPELADWLSNPDNAKHAVAEVPQLQQLSAQAKSLGGEDLTGVLPQGYIFKRDGTIRGPLHADGTDPVVYKDLDTLRQKFERQASREASEQRVNEVAAERLKDSWFPSITAGMESSVASTESAISRVTGGRFTFGGMDGADLARGGETMMAGSQKLDPSIGGGLGRTIGSLIGDAPLYLMGGEVVGAADALGGVLGTIKAATRLPLVPQSEYLKDVWKTALAYSPIAARSGINTGSENGAAYGSVDFLINALGPAAFGSKVGLAAAIVPGTETAAASAGWGGVAGRLLKHVGSQGGVMATTELANALHEYATGVDPEALNSDRLVPRLAQAGAMGAIMSGAFHLPGSIRDQVYRQQVAAHAAMMHADALGALMESAEALKSPESTPAQFQELLKATIPDAQRTKFLQGEDFEGIAKAANITPDDLATSMGIGDEYKKAVATGQSMTVPTHLLLKYGMEHEDPLVKKALLTAARSSPVGINANEALKFYKETPDELAAQKLALETDVTKAAGSLKESDPIYQDMMSQVEEAGRPSDEARADAKLMAARFNTLAVRHNAHVDANGGKRMDPLEEYQAYKLKVQKDNPGGTGIEPFDALLDRVRKGDFPSERQAYGKSLVEFLSSRGVKDPTGELAKAGAGKVIDENGHDIALAAERAHDEGYIEDAEPATLIDAIKAEHAGRPVFSPQNRIEDLHLLRSGSVALAQHLASKGIDIAKPNPEIKAALAGDPMVGRFEQRLSPATAFLSFTGLLKQWKKANGDRSPTPGDKDWTKLVEQARLVDEANGRVFHQPGEDGHRGSLEFSAERHFVMTLTGNANWSTVMHEAGHFWLETMGDYIERADAAPQIKADYQKILDYLGVKDRASIAVEHHEKFARAIEQYLMEGHAPSPELRDTFQRFAIWLGDLYKQFKALVHLTPEVKAVFDRMLATDEAIERVQKDLGTSTIFKDQASSGMKDEAWGKYLKSVQRERLQAQTNVFNKAMAVLRRENTRTYNREKDKAIVSATTIISQRPVYVAVRALAHGLDADGKEIASPPKLDKHEIERDYGKGTISKLPRGITSDEGGMSLQAAADVYGFHSGADLWTALANYKKPREAIRELADQIMKAHHPEMTPEAMHETAMEAVHANNAHADVLSQESAALAIHALKRPIPQEQMKAIAERMVDETNMRDVNPQNHLRAEIQASDASTKAFLQSPPDYTAAFLHKQRQELSHALYRASMEAQEVIEAAGVFMKKMAKTETRQMLGKAGGFVITGKNGERLATLDPVEAAQIAKEYEGTTENYRDAMDRMSDFWADKAQRYDMDFGALHDFYREASAIHHQAKEAHDIVVDGQRADLAQAILDATTTQREAVKGKVVSVPRDKRSLGYQARDFMRQFDAGNRTLAAITRSMDGEKADGWHYRNVTRPLNEAANDEMARRIHNSVEMRNLVKTWDKRGRKDPVYIPSIGEHMNLEQRIGVALNAGTQRNMERMTTGDGWTREQVDHIIGTLDERDVALVKGIWSLLESKWPESSALHSRLTGIPPEKKEPIPVKTRFGTIDGGYYPILYDKDVGARAYELTLDKPTNPLMGTPRAGHLKTTVETTGMRLQYGFDALFRHLDDSAHYISHAETAANLNKILNNADFKQSVIDRFGIRTFEALTERVRNVLEGPRGPQNAFERATRFMRVRSGLATCGYNLMTVLVHGFGIPQSMFRVGAGKWLAAQGHLISSAGSAESGYAFIAEKSAFMRDSRHNVTPETAERLSQGAMGGALKTLHDHALDGLHFALRGINSATWLAEYRTRMEEAPGDEARAIQLADQAVRDTQGSGQTVDKTHYQDKSELTKMFMQYASFFTRTYQLLRPSVANFDKSDPATYMAAMKAFLPLVVLPAITEGMFRQMVKPENPGEDHDAAWWAKRLAKDNIEYMLSTFIGGREFSGMVEGMRYSGPASMRSVGSIGTAFGSALRLFNDPSATTGERAVRSATAMAGLAFGIPSNQIDHILQGILYMHEHGSVNPAPALFGPPH